MKKYLYLLVALLSMAMASCNEDEQFEGELYKKVIYLLSEDDYSFSNTHALGETSTGYVTVYCGGTEHLSEDVTVEFEADPDGLAAYNKLYYDIDESKFAKQLDPSKYSIKSFSATIKADQEDNYALLPIEVTPDGLSPDSIYMVPLRVKNISAYELNTEKASVLYRVVLKNLYATMEETTYYQMTGTETSHMSNGVVSSGISLTRVVAPLSKNQVRMFVGTNTYVPSKVTKEQLAKYAMVVTINDNNTLTITPYGDIEVEQLGGDADNFIEKNAKGQYVMHLHYRYKDTVTANDKTEKTWVEMVEKNVQRN